MKFSLQLIVTAALSVALVVCCLVTYFGGSADREIGSNYLQARTALAGHDPLFTKGEPSVPDNAIAPLERLCALKPEAYELQMTLVGLYFKNRNANGEYLKKARELCEKIASEKNPDPSLRSLALVHLGMMLGSEAAAAKPLERATKLAEAKARFEEAKKLDDASGDAYAGLGLVALWEGHAEEAGKLLAEALKPSRQMGIEVLPEVYNAQALVAAAKNDLPAARARFAAAKEIKTEFAKASKAPGEWKAPDENLRRIEEGTVGVPKMDAAARKKLLEALDKRLKDMKDGDAAKLAILNSVGCGYFHVGNLSAAADRLTAATKLAPTSADLWTNLFAVRVAALDACRAGQEEARKADAGKAREALLAAEQAFDAAAAGYIANANPPAAVRADLALIRVEMRLRWSAAERDASAAAMKGENPDKAKSDALRAKSAKTAEEADAMLAEALAGQPDEPRLLRLKGIRELTAGLTKESLATFNKSLAGNAEQPDVKAITDEFVKPLEIVAFRPGSFDGKAGPVLASSSRPLLGVLFRANTGPIPLPADKIRLSLDGVRLDDGAFWGTEYIYLPEKPLADGEHVLVAEGQDALGHAAKGETRFVVDDSPPEIASVSPADNEPATGPRPKIVVTCKDKYSGVDPASVEVLIRSVRAETMFTEPTIRGGRYTYTYEAMGMKKGESAGQDKFTFTTTRDVGPGTYSIEFTVCDQRGLKTSKTWTLVIQ